MKLILASRSPQRVQLLNEAGYEFVTVPADIDEEAYPRHLAPHQIARWLASAKAESVQKRHPDDLILAADTLVVLGNQILGKPENESHARQMLERLSGSTHQVITGIALVGPDNQPYIVDHVTSDVRMKVLTSQQVHDYVVSGDWRGKAGGYGIQDPDPFVVCLTGSFSNVIGLPMERIQELPLDFYRKNRLSGSTS